MSWRPYAHACIGTPHAVLAREARCYQSGYANTGTRLCAHVESNVCRCKRTCRRRGPLTCAARPHPIASSCSVALACLSCHVTVLCPCRMSSVAVSCPPFQHLWRRSLRCRCRTALALHAQPQHCHRHNHRHRPAHAAHPGPPPSAAAGIRAADTRAHRAAALGPGAATPPKNAALDLSVRRHSARRASPAR